MAHKKIQRSGAALRVLEFKRSWTQYLFRIFERSVQFLRRLLYPCFTPITPTVRAAVLSSVLDSHCAKLSGCSPSVRGSPVSLSVSSSHILDSGHSVTTLKMLVSSEWLHINCLNRGKDDDIWFSTPPNTRYSKKMKYLHSQCYLIFNEKHDVPVEGWHSAAICICFQKSLCKIRILPNIPNAVCFLYSLQLYWYCTDKSLYLVSLRTAKKAVVQSNTKCEDITWNKRMARFATPYEALNNRPVLSL